MYVLKHFDHEAKETMLEMVGDIREEFKNILDEVCSQTRQIIQYIAIERDTYTSASKKKIFANLMVSFFGFSYWKIDWPRLGHYFFCQGTGRFLNLLFRMWTGFMQGLDWAGQYQEDFRKAKKSPWLRVLKIKGELSCLLKFNVPFSLKRSAGCYLQITWRKWFSALLTQVT